MTVYRTDCGCLSSSPEPNAAEYPTIEQWRRKWHEAAARHVSQCPKSVYYVEPTYSRCIVCGAEPAPILADRPEDYDWSGRHVGACYCRQHVPAGVPTVEIVPGVSGVYFVTRDATGEIVQDDRPWQLREGVSS